jgi:hypothetical protein
MLLRQKTRNCTAAYQGPGGRYCVCCDDGPKWNKRNRRTVRRVENRKWRKDWNV